MVLMEPVRVCSVTCFTATCNYALLIVLPHVKLQRQSILLITTFGITFLENDLIGHNIPLCAVSEGPPALKKKFWEIFYSFHCFLEAIPKKDHPKFFSTCCALGGGGLIVSCYIPQTGF